MKHAVTLAFVFGCIVAGLGCGSGGSASGSSNATSSGSSSTTNSGQPIALVYHDASTDCCSQALATLIANDPKYKFQVILVGPDESTSVPTGLAMPGVAIYAQPGGNGDYQTAYKAEKAWAGDIQAFVSNGGRYLGVCMGGYLAEVPDAFDLFTGDTEEYTTTSGASTQSTNDTVIPILWRGVTRMMYFQDGAAFSGGTNAEVIATYTNGLGAAVITTYGNGKVGVLGPHPEAPQSWYSDYGLTYPGSTADLGYDFIETLMQ